MHNQWSLRGHKAGVRIQCTSRAVSQSGPGLGGGGWSHRQRHGRLLQPRKLDEEQESCASEFEEHREEGEGSGEATDDQEP